MWTEQSQQELLTNSTERNTTGAQDFTQVYEAVRWIQLLMALLSVLGSGSIIVSVMLQRLSRKPELQPLFLLSVSDLLLSVCWLVGAALFSQRCSSLNRHCYHLHTVEQILYMASFFYTLNFVWNLYTGIREKLYSCLDGYSVQFSNRVSTANRVTALLSGIIPVVLMTPVFIPENISRCQANFSEPYRCLLMHTGALYLTSEENQPIRVCRLLHVCRIAIFITTFFITLLSIIVSDRHTHTHTHTHTDSLVTGLSVSSPPAPGAHGESSSYSQASGDIKRLPGHAAAGLLPCDGRADAPVPADLPPVLGSSRGSGVPAGGEAVSGSGRGGGRALHLTGSDLGLSGLPQLSGVRLDSSSSVQNTQEGLIS
uniref:transmembrane protein 116 isoform X1 n=1 Tax=Semicossyphus pulcher TaxID=241346 RepID=UPI0037E9C3E5